MTARKRAALFALCLAGLPPAQANAQEPGAISFERRIEMAGPMLAFSGAQTGAATVAIDLCLAPAPITGSGTLAYEGAGARARVQLVDVASGTVALSGGFACHPRAPATISWQETWSGSQLATPPVGEPKQFDLAWSDLEALSFPLSGDPVAIERPSDVSYPRSPVDVTTATTSFSLRLCLRICDPERLLRAMRGSAAFLQAYDDDALAAPGIGGAGYEASVAEAALAAPLVRTNQATCAIEANASDDPANPDFRPLSDPGLGLDCVLRDVLVALEVEQSGLCRALNRCESDPDDPFGAGTGCQSAESFGERRGADLEALREAALQAHCAALRRGEWWIAQHLKCSPDAALEAEARALAGGFEAICASRGF